MHFKMSFHWNKTKIMTNASFLNIDILIAIRELKFFELNLLHTLLFIIKTAMYVTRILGENLAYS
jgi:hypothetical protein